MENSIHIDGVGKRYKVYGSRKDRLKDWLLPGRAHRFREKWVLRDVSLEVKPGEAVGIVGMNGTGKSTLLKIITGTTLPTTRCARRSRGRRGSGRIFSSWMRRFP